MKNQTAVTGGYRVIRPIATGEFGSVILVSIEGGPVQTEPRPLALKIMPTSEGTRQEYSILRAFRLGLVPGTVFAAGRVRLATLPADLAKAANLPRDVGKTGYEIIAMQYIPGQTLRTYLSSCAVECGSGSETLDAFSYARPLVDFSYCAYQHFRIGHGDFKLGNILVERKGTHPRLAVIDFTFGERYPLNVQAEDQATEWHRGTLCYMAPERIFFIKRPGWVDDAAAASTDIWATGTIMATVALTGAAFPDMDMYQQLAVLDNDRRFNPTFTDTPYQLLSPDNMPWLDELVSLVSSDSGLPPSFVLQAIRLVLWSTALNRECRAFSPREGDNDRFASLREGCPRFQVFSFHLELIHAEYAKHGKDIFEVVVEELRSRMGEHVFKVYLLTQRWDPLSRSRGTPGGGEHVNPFQWLQRELGNDVFVPERSSKQHDLFAQQVWSVPDDTFESLPALFSRLATQSCSDCGSAISLRHRGLLCQVCELDT